MAFTVVLDTCVLYPAHMRDSVLRTDVATIVMFNTGDFSDESVDQFEVDVIDPDAFLLDLLDLASQTVKVELAAGAAANPERIEVCPRPSRHSGPSGVPQFGEKIRHQL